MRGRLLREENMKERTGKPAWKTHKNRMNMRRASPSIYFLLWATFSAFSLIIVLLFGLTQNAVMRSSYESEIAINLADHGKIIRRELLEYQGPSYSAFVHYQAQRYNVGVYILNADGSVVFPVDEDSDENFSERFGFSEKMERLLEHLEASPDGEAVYEDPSGIYVYGAEMTAYDGTTEEGRTVYLYVFKPLELVRDVIDEMNIRTLLIAIFVLVLSFAVSSAISGLLTKPIAEMTEKAKLLARGDFSVDFHGKSYGGEMEQLAATLNFARDEISRSDRMQKELIANVSHDFKTPLTMIKAYASMIQEISGDNPEKRAKHTQVIIDEADRLTSLVNDVLDLSKIRSGIETLKPTVFDLSSYTQDVLERFGYLSEKDGYRFDAEIEEGLYTCADCVKIGEVLYNLIGNAVNYTGEDKKVRVVLRRQPDGTVLFSVTDTGKGIRPEELSTIWDRYYRSSEAHKRPVKGTGLGLSIVRTILEKHNFRFGVESTVGKGSTFYVIFPYADPPEEEKRS